MMQRRTLRIATYVLIFVIGTIVIDGYDVLTGGNIKELFSEPIRGCF